ncbi:heme-binding protein [Occallatibacter savannae]|uniref:heme-binding protein n=1 Tax=Occallatibacter savannae TaxID=1002691 RepID=UPI0013A56243|nr:heme-binding protein [Occallatibacter savannae]
MARISSTRIAPDSGTVLKQLGLLGELVGNWKGHGFNLIARPDFHDNTDLYLQLNQTRETLKFEAIGSPIPNRGFGQDDIELFGLTYLQQIADAGKDGALHIEPGIWITQPNTSFPPESVPEPQQLVARMGTIPHGNSILVEGVAAPFVGSPVLKSGGSQYSFSLFPSFNSTPFGVQPTAPGAVFNAAGSSEKLTAPTVPATPFPQYDTTIPIGPIPPGPLNPPFTLNTRTPFDTNPPEPPLPANINGVPIQDVVNDPITLLQKDVQDLVNQGYTFEGVSLNISTETPLTFLTNPNSGPGGPKTTVNVPQFGGGIENIQFLAGESQNIGGTQKPVENADTAIVYATFWIEKAHNKNTGHSFIQLQYAQMVVLNFPILHLLKGTPPTYVNLGWPHITVATLKKSFS